MACGTRCRYRCVSLSFRGHLNITGSHGGKGESTVPRPQDPRQVARSGGDSTTFVEKEFAFFLTWPRWAPKVLTTSLSLRAWQLLKEHVLYATELQGEGN